MGLDKVTNPNYVRMVSNLDEVGNFGSVGNTSGNARHDIHPYGKDELQEDLHFLQSTIFMDIGQLGNGTTV